MNWSNPSGEPACQPEPAAAVTVQFGLASDYLLTLVAPAASGTFSRQL